MAKKKSDSITKVALIVLAVAVIGFVTYGVMSTTSQPLPVEEEGFPETRIFRITYGGSFQSMPQDAQDFRAWIPLASSRDGQRIISKAIELDVPYHITTDSQYGNEMVYFEIKGMLPEKIPFKMTYDVEVSREAFLKDNQTLDPSAYLKPSRLMKITEEVVRMSEKAVEGKTSANEKIRGIYDAVLAHMAYDKKTPGYGQGDTLRACRVRKGNCTDFHSLFISMAQSVKIPARFKMGLPVPRQSIAEADIADYHCWAEFYEEGRGWLPVDASEAWKHPEKREDYFGNFDTNKFLLSVGRDIELVPKPKGSPVNFFFYPYAEIGGEAFGVFDMEYAYERL